MWKCFVEVDKTQEIVKAHDGKNPTQPRCPIPQRLYSILCSYNWKQNIEELNRIAGSAWHRIEYYTEELLHVDRITYIYFSVTFFKIWDT